MAFDIREVTVGSGLARKQRLFARLFHQLQARAYSMGYEVVLGETWRGPGEVARLVGLGKGHPKTRHALCLAGHMWLFRDSKYLTAWEDYRDLGEWWVQQHPLCCWGGHFGSRDAVHFSVIHQGIA